MGVASLLLAPLIGAAAVSSDEIRWFPGDYFDSRVRSGLHRKVMESWPGPAQLLQRWNDGELNDEERVALLLGGAAYHDPQLLPVYREAMVSTNQRIRQAAVYGYRDVLADGLPDVRRPVDDDAAGLLAEESMWVERTLAESSLVEFWLQALLAIENHELPGWRGVTFDRSPEVCYRAIEQLVSFEDLDTLLVAYDISQDFQTRVNLIKLIEAVSLTRLIVKPQGKKGWGRHIFTEAMDTLEGRRRQWTANDCEVDGEAVLIGNLRAMGVSGVDPLSEQGCQVWVNVLDKGDPRWWMLASRQLYSCGGPWLPLSALVPDSERDRDRRMTLLSWFAPLRPGARGTVGRRYND